MPSPPIAAIADHLGFWLRMVSNHVSHAFAARLADHDVTVAEWSVMRMLHGRPPIAPSALASEMGLTRGAISKLADRLAAKSLLQRHASVDDGRAQTLALTPQGAALVPLLAALADQNDADAFQSLSAADRQALDRILKQLVERSRIQAIPLN